VIRRFLLALILLVGVVAVLWAEVERRWQQPLIISSGGYHLTLASGVGLREVVGELGRAGVLDSPYLLLAYGRWSGLDKELKRGEYLIPIGTTAAGLLELLSQGSVIQYRVTLPEGITLARAIDLLAEDEHLIQDLEGPNDPRILALVAPHNPAEGLFFPDSYRYEAGASSWEILQRAHRKMQRTLAEEWQGRVKSLPYETAYDALIMASIIERETGVARERGRIAGVFVQRLQKRMRLQTDPTVIYGLGVNFDGNLQRKHLQDESNLYNSYRHHGLPPSPISLPGRAAINAALNPDKSKALYFVARGDGSHVFSDTLQEHQSAVRKYQLNRSKNYRSSPEK